VKRLNLPAGIAETSDLDHSFGTKPESRARRQGKQVDAARCHVFSDRAGLDIEAACAKLVEQFLVDQMHLPQIRYIRTFGPDVIAMLHLLAHVRIPFHTEASYKADRQLIGFAESVISAAAHCGDDRGHVDTLLGLLRVNG
jgi:hypothetical protein